VTKIGEALVEVLLHALEEGQPRVRRVVAWISETARPPAGVRLVADDGTEYTGIVLVEANRPKLMFALRVGTTERAAPREVQYPRAAPYSRPVLDDPLWRDDEYPYR
jgi:hypothetical protein